MIGDRTRLKRRFLPDPKNLKAKKDAKSSKTSDQVDVSGETSVSHHSPKMTTTTTTTTPCSVVLERMDFAKWFEESGRPPSPISSSEPSDGRLGKQENGMVLLPRTFYNKHPAKMINDKRKMKPKTSPRSPKPVKALIEDVNDECEYRLVFVDPAVSPVAPVTPAPPGDFTLKNLSEQIDANRLPSEMWEMERIPPLINLPESDSRYDAIAAELEMLMGDTGPDETETPHDVKMETDPSPVVCSTPETVTEVPEKCTELSENVDSKEPHIKMDIDVEKDEFPSIMEILNEPPAIKTENEEMTDTDLREEKSDVENRLSEPDESTMDTDKMKNNPDAVSKSEDEKTVKHNETEILESEGSKVESEKRETIIESNGEMDLEHVTSATKTKISQPAENDPKSNDTLETGITNEYEEKKESDGDKRDVVHDYVPKSVIFRRLTQDKQTYDRLVTFHENMEYIIAINDKKIQLLGAPGFITSMEDLEILLQIVDDITLNSFNVELES